MRRNLLAAPAGLSELTSLLPPSTSSSRLFQYEPFVSAWNIPRDYNKEQSDTVVKLAFNLRLTLVTS